VLVKEYLNPFKEPQHTLHPIMAGRLPALGVLARRVMAPKAALPVRAEGGGPVKMGKAIDHPVSVLATRQTVQLHALSSAARC
jgi:hypothetical protein